MSSTSQTLASRSFMRHRWRPTAAAFFVNGAGYGVWATQIPLTKERLGLDPAVLGMTLLVIGGGAVLAMAASGWLMRQFGAATLIRISGAIFCVSLPLTAVAPNLPVLVLVLFVLGAAGGSMDVSMNAHAAQVERATGQAFMSSFHGMWSVGGLAGAGIGGILLYVLPSAAQMLLLALLLGSLLAWAQPHFLEREGVSAGGGGHVSLRPEAIAVFIGVLAGLCFEAEGTVLDWGSIFLKLELGSAAEMASAGFAAFSATMAIGRFLGDRVRHAWGGVAILRVGSLIAAAGLAVGPLTSSTWLTVAGFALAGLGLSNAVPVLISAAGKSKHPDTAIAVVTTLGYAGLLAGPPLLGFVAHATNYATIFLVSAAMCLTMVVCAGVVRGGDRA